MSRGPDAATLLARALARSAAAAECPAAAWAGWTFSFTFQSKKKPEGPRKRPLSL